MKSKNILIGRDREKNILKDCLESGHSGFVAVYGRRRIGKTFLIKTFFKNKFDFYMTGVVGSTISETLEYFNLQL